MELNEPFEGHEHATTSLKVVLLVFAIVLVGALAYLVQATYSQPDATEEVAPSVKDKTEETSTTGETTTETDEMADWKTYTNTTYKASFKYPADWKVRETTPDSNSTAPFSYYGQYVSFQPITVTQDFLGYIAFAPRTTYTSVKEEFVGTVGVVSSKEEDTTLAGLKGKKVTVEKVSGGINMTLVMYALEIGNVNDIPHWAYLIGDNSISADTAADKANRTTILRIFESLKIGG